MNDREESNSYGNSPLVPNAVLFNRKTNVRRGSRCPLSAKNAPVIDYKNITELSKYVSEGGKIIPTRITNVSAKMQRRLKKAINIARTLALLPYAAK